MMATATSKALAHIGNVLNSRVDAIHVVKGIWPYVNPGHLIAERIPGLAGRATPPELTITTMGGNASYDAVGTAAAAIAEGEHRVAVVCGAETMRTRRTDKAAGRRSPYLREDNGLDPPTVLGEDIALSDDVDASVRIDHPVHFYALVERRIRYRRRETAIAHRDRIAAMWADASSVAASNPAAWIRDPVGTQTFTEISSSNRMVSTPYSKLLTSNINVDQGGAIVLASYGAARAAGLSDEQMVFVLGSGHAYDHPTIRAREELDRSPAIAAVARAVIGSCGIDLSSIDAVDLYSCFPSAVEVARREIGLEDGATFTMTGGMTFAGGPFNGYGTQAVTHAAEALRGTNNTALLTGNGGYLTKHSALVLGGEPPRLRFGVSNPQYTVDRKPTRPLADPRRAPQKAAVETYTVPFDRDGNPEPAIVSVIDVRGRRYWTVAPDESDRKRFASDEDLIHAPVALTVKTADDTPTVVCRLQSARA